MSNKACELPSIQELKKYNDSFQVGGAYSTLGTEETLEKTWGRLFILFTDWERNLYQSMLLQHSMDKAMKGFMLSCRALVDVYDMYKNEQMKKFC